MGSYGFRDIDRLGPAFSEPGRVDFSRFSKRKEKQVSGRFDYARITSDFNPKKYGQMWNYKTQFRLNRVTPL